MYFYEDLQRFGTRAALITTSSTITYQSLERAAGEFCAHLGEPRRFIFLECSNTPAAIVAYLGCLKGAHAVYLFSKKDREKANALARKYQPNAIVRASEDQPRIDWIHDRPVMMHPSLRVLLSTSGSTGSPKLIKLSARNLDSNANSIVEYLQLSDADKAILSLRFNYSFGMSIVNSHLACGGSLLLTEESVADDGFWSLAKAGEATSLSGVPYTFETLKQMGSDKLSLASLRYLTQAGGRLDPELVLYFSRLGQEHGWLFFVMYGQTEASPRIAYLPSSLAQKYPSCIGVPIPGGTISLLNDKGEEVNETDSPGELAYLGPNVMMGYAHTPPDLATDDTPPYLLTGDIACRNNEGLYYIVGRTSRFIKPFGMRLNLDDVQAEVRKVLPSAICAGTNEKVVIAVLSEQWPERIEIVLERISALYDLPRSVFEMVCVDEIPILSNGKPDYGAVRSLVGPSAINDVVSENRGTLRDIAFIVFSKEYFIQIWRELRRSLGFHVSDAEGVAEIYTDLAPGAIIQPSDSFSSLAGDSLSYVEKSIAIETYLGYLPRNWEKMTVEELEGAKQAVADAY